MFDCELVGKIGSMALIRRDEYDIDYNVFRNNFVQHTLYEVIRYLLYSAPIYETSDVIQTYVYRQGILNNNYSSASAVGLLNSMINFSIVFVANRMSRKLTDTAIW